MVQNGFWLMQGDTAAVIAKSRAMSGNPMIQRALGSAGA